MGTATTNRPPSTCKADRQIAANVRAELARAQLTGNGVAPQLRISQSGMSRRLCGQQSFTLAELNNIAKLTKSSIATLLAGVQ